MTASDREDGEMDVVTPDHLPPDSIQETISKQWLNSLRDTTPLHVSRETSSRLETGIFLQQLTNSVNRALHKQNCTCSGKSYTADELRCISHPAMFAPSPAATSASRLNQGTVTLPPIDDAGSKNAASDILSANSSPLKVYLERESGKKLGAPTKRGSPGTKPLGVSLVTEKEKEELKLPSIMDIMDINGNNWKIVQDINRQRHPRTARYDTKLFDGQSVHLQECRSPPKTPSGNSRVGASNDGNRHQSQGLGDSVSDAAIDAVTRSNSPRDVIRDSTGGLHEAGDPTVDRVMTRADDRPRDSPSRLPELAPRCTLLQINQSPRLNADSVQTTYDEAERRALLLQLNSAVRTGKMPHAEFLRRVSGLAPSFRLEKGRDKRTRTSSMEQAIPERIKRQDTKHSIDQVWTHEPHTINAEAATAANTLASSSYTGIYAKDPHALFPPELQNLYSRGGLKVTTLKIDVGDSLPDNFLTKEKEDLQVMYPMYGSRVELEKGSVAARMNSLQSKGEKVLTDSPREKKTAMANDMGVLLLPTHSGLAPSDPDDFKLRFRVRKGPDGQNREGRMYCLQGRQSISREGEILDLPPESYVRRISGSECTDRLCPSRNFPKQPPTTPADDRRQSQDTLSELVARSIPNTIPESSDATDQEDSDHHHTKQEKSTSRSLGKIPEDPLDSVSRANTYGTELDPKRLAEAFGESLEKEDAKVVREYVDVVVPTNRKASGKGKRVSWHPYGVNDDATTDFTKSRETLQSIQTNEKPATPDRMQLAFTISDVSEGHAGRDGIKPAVQVLEIDESSVGTFESLSRRYEANGMHCIPEGGNTFMGDVKKDGKVSVSTQRVVFVSPAHSQKKSEDTYR